MQRRADVLIVVPQRLVVGRVKVVIVLALWLRRDGEYRSFPRIRAPVDRVDDPAPVQPAEQGQVGVEVEAPGEVGYVAGSAQGRVGASVVVETINPMLPERSVRRCCRP